MLDYQDYHNKTRENANAPKLVYKCLGAPVLAETQWRKPVCGLAEKTQGIDRKSNVNHSMDDSYFGRLLLSAIRNIKLNATINNRSGYKSNPFYFIDSRAPH
ncbi:17242_t:CDS:2 [Cetraspora pellucida]|uniref:17242_t:CDS:1 n=1 Tax=Cetraspora pellucida TaxID=1433469 RepID=A0A9N9GAA0_9GLOM|nr:17242_t:CDS:2 [Cetraspora pellucida]